MNMTRLPEIHSSVASVLPKEFAMYKRLRQMDRDVDFTVRKTRRMLDADIKTAAKTARRLMKLCIYHTYIPPPTGSTTATSKLDKTTHDSKVEESPSCTSPSASNSTSTDTGTSSTAENSVVPVSEEPQGTWTLRIEGRLINAPNSKRRFSSFFRKIVVELDPELYADSTVEWSCFRSKNDSDGFEVTKKGSTPHTVQVKLIRNYSPEHFAISEGLSQLLSPYLTNRSHGTRQEITMALYQYIKERHLVQENDCRMIVSDAALQEVFGCFEMRINTIMEKLHDHLHPVPPIHLQYYLSLNSKSGKEVLLDEQTLDVEVDMEEDLDVVREDCLKASVELHERNKKELEALDTQISESISKLNEVSKQREWFASFVRDPCRFTQQIVKSQANDLNILNAPYEQTNDLPSETFAQPFIVESVQRLWSKRQMEVPLGTEYPQTSMALPLPSPSSSPLPDE